MNFADKFERMSQNWTATLARRRSAAFHSADPRVFGLQTSRPPTGRRRVRLAEWRLRQSRTLRYPRVELCVTQNAFE